MGRPGIKFLTDFGPLLVFFIMYFRNDQSLKIAIPPFVIATIISLAIVYSLEKKMPMVPLTSGILITLFGGLTLYFDNKIFFYMKPTIINILFAGILFFGKFFTKKPFIKKIWLCYNSIKFFYWVILVTSFKPNWYIVLYRYYRCFFWTDFWNYYCRLLFS